MIGADNLLNQVLLYFIDNEIALPCAIYSQPLHLLTDAEGSGIEDLHSDTSDYLFLVDCYDRDIEETTKEIISNHYLNGHRIAFYNLLKYSDSEAKALSKRIRGFFYVHDSTEILLKGIRAIFNDEVWISRHILLHHILNRAEARILENNLVVELTRREQQILSLVSVGLSTDEIAEKLCVSVNTVKTHMYNIFKKIQVKNRLQAALWAAKHL